MPVLKKLFSEAVKNQAIVNNMVSSVLRSYRIEHPKLYYVDMYQKYNKKNIESDRKLIRYLKQHPVITKSSFLNLKSF